MVSDEDTHFLAPELIRRLGAIDETGMTSEDADRAFLRTLNDMLAERGRDMNRLARSVALRADWGLGLDG